MTLPDRLRTARHGLRELRTALHGLRELRPARRTVDAPVHERPAPRPSAFRGFGAGSWLVPPCQLDGAGRTSVGTGVVVLEHADIRVGLGGSLRIGDRVRLGRFAVIHCELAVELGDDVSGSDLVAITDCDGPMPPAPVVVEDGAYLGAGCVLHPGVRVGRGAYVGEGAVVVDDVAPHAVVFGNPARVVRAG